MNPYQMHPYASGSPESEPEISAEEKPQEEALPENAEGQTQPEETREPAESQACEEKAKAELEEARLRMAAEMDNFKKRLQREHTEQMRFAAEKVLADLLPALDNLDLAIQYGSRHEACADMMQGIEMTRKQLLEAVAKNGLAAIGARGEQFDPAIHEAVGMEADPELEKGAVTKVLQNGYKLNDRLMRPAKVMVNN